MKDLIDRQETIKEIKELANLYPYKVKGDRESYSKYNEAWSDCVDMAESAVLNQLTVEAIPINWILDYKDKYTVITSEECDPVKAEVIVDMLAEWVEKKEK